MRVIFFVIVAAAFPLAVFAQTSSKANGPAPAAAAAAPSALSPLQTARLTLEAHGGKRLSEIRSLAMSGSVGITTSAITQEIPATFSLVFSGERYRFDLMNPFQPIKQAFDGKVTSSTIQNGFEMPPMNRLGFIMLSKVGDPAFPVTALPGGRKERAGFRITSPEGFYTDYLVDEKTHQMKGYESSYEVNGRNVTTSVEIDRYRIVAGVVVPEKFAQRFDLGQLTAYANFKVKDIAVNGEIADEIFTITK
jgi:hypothetical protein